MKLHVRALAIARAAAASAVLSLATAVPFSQPAAAWDAKAAEKSTLRVAIFVEQNGKKVFGGHGTGFVIDRDYIATNWHVASPSEIVANKMTYKLYVISPYVTNFTEAEIVWTSEALDLAVLRVPNLGLPTLEISSLEPPGYPGKSESIFVVGYPGIADKFLKNPDEQEALKVFREPSITRGVVSRIVVARLGTAGQARPIIQHDAVINPGNSGGPLFDACNRVVGVNTYSTPNQLRVVKDEKGDQYAVGQVAPGFYSPHISNLVSAVRTIPELRNIRLSLSSSACDADEGGTSPLVIALSGVTLLVALGAIALAVFRRREVVRVVESYSAWIGRKGLQPGAKRTDSRLVRPPIPAPARPAKTPSPAPRPPAPAAAPAAAATPDPAPAPGDWTLYGEDSVRNVIALAITPADLERADGQAEKGLVLGRSASMADKIVNDPSVSRRHAKISRNGDGIAIEDLKSAYGTKVNGQALEPFQPVALQPGDQVLLGSVTLTIGRA